MTCTDGVISMVPRRFVSTVWNLSLYTHLRAHETVLDLVCRLLLEKKNRTSVCYLRVRLNVLLMLLSQTLDIIFAQSCCGPMLIS